MQKLIPVAVLLAACSGSTTEPAKDGLPAGDARLPDIVLVSIDTLRADHLSAYGHERETSPFIDRLAKDGVRFEHARSASPWTLPAHTTMLSGQLPATHKVVDDNLSLDKGVPVLPEVLKARGYRTAGVVATLYVSELFGFDRGFDHFQDFDLHTEKANLAGDVVAQDVVDDALSWWAEQPKGEPVFLFLHVYDVHYEYDPPEPYASMFDRPPEEGDRKYRTYFHFKKKPLKKDELEHQLAQYDESIRYVDDQLKRLDDAAKAAGRNVRWVITADHGEEFGERRSWGHAHTLYAEQLHIPLIMSGPGLPTGQVIEETVGNHDIAPTVAAWAGAPITSLEADGIDLNAAWQVPEAAEGGEAPVEDAEPAGIPSRPFLAETTRFKTNRLSLYEDGLRLEWDLKANRKELYDTEADPTEIVDLARDRPEDVARLASRTTELLGSPWTARSAGQVLPEKAVVLFEGDRKARMDVAEGTAFQVLPYDAVVGFVGPDGGHVGSYAQVGDAAKRPEDGAPLALEVGSGGAGDVALDDAQREFLESIGYLQGDEEEEEDSVPDEEKPEGADAGH